MSMWRFAQRKRPRTPMAVSRDVLASLQQEYRLIQLVYHRNRNQHQSARWWNRFNMLKRNCDAVLRELMRGDPHVVRMYRLLGSLRKQLPQTYYAFNGVIALNQFVTLGVVLVGLLSRVFALYNQITDEFTEQFKALACKRRVTSSQIQPVTPSQPTTEELGVELNLLMTEVTSSRTPPSPTVPATKSRETKTKKRKPKKKKSAIDSIFG
ncbi:Rmp1p KNAG_0A02840 [Huiozyma naganishii CBS 8797]|uniref:RNase MRP protein 1 RNA binding domain-containing protein n=1 Tax=Huiozyma naganishii (strain ATCC MYA-139 / BCRC 22969 / CBS 8797 / KCTC 17520 / NBRC 10181 / NCYC 3082 / Yp74L-3) TaxID=1071383 RepID=J7REL3_HUIN7|nr:hypothetical protein KNAG_0A02840 [Kazachstania naganishii CBS 8797]CCK67973.1 hypothetical protein KNAG_0A02840 [Kazachstania naganishii CBS 8797]